MRYSVTTTATLSSQTSKATAGYLVAQNVQISGPKSTMYSAGRPFQIPLRGIVDAVHVKIVLLRNGK
ncbi:hypothetical protein T11_10847 [Trichinella zimbabwensis]|uniref:Uncharacterized protein n=1 Tax=Trichinella zimbabwensis TaxID=268475 RepID=A0A0V1GWS9_9BILA|nr:hypothetical protein T11_10847 [Trichinella zimbabwensis]